MGVWIETNFVSHGQGATTSLLMWECGLKHRLVGIRKDICNVTPYVGVWIETRLYRRIVNRFVVTPYVGVWIETTSSLVYSHIPVVTPYVGVWIETQMTDVLIITPTSLLMWECGLKHLTH